MDRLSSTAVEPYGRVYFPRESHMAMTELFAEIEEYFADGVTLKRGDVVFDVGANIGAFAIAASRLTEGDVQLFCFEPAPVPFSALRRNVLENAWLSRSKHRLLNVALSSVADAGQSTEFYYFARVPTDSTLDIAQKRREFEKFFAHHGARLSERIRTTVPGAVGRGLARVVGAVVTDGPKGPVGRWLSDRVTGLERVTCEQEAIARLLPRLGVQRIDLLKIDVEGFEAQVLDGVDDATWPCIRQVVVETYDRDGRVEKLLGLFERHGFDQRRVARPAIAADRGLDNVILSAVRTEA
jgi:FkbM family methyltransferase